MTGQIFHLVGHHGKAFAGLTRACRFDGGVQGQQIGLAGDVIDQLHHLADFVRSRGQRQHHGIGAGGFVRGFVGDAGSLGHLTADFRNGCGQFFGRGGNGLHIAGRLFRRRRHIGGLGAGLLSRSGQSLRGFLHFSGRSRHRIDHAHDAALEIVGQLGHGLFALCRRLFGRLFLLRPQRRHLGRIVLEDLQGQGHFGHLVLMLRGGNGHRQIPLGQCSHGRSHGMQRRRNPARNKDGAAEAQKHRNHADDGKDDLIVFDVETGILGGLGRDVVKMIRQLVVYFKNGIGRLQLILFSRKKFRRIRSNTLGLQIGQGVGGDFHGIDAGFEVCHHLTTFRLGDPGQKAIILGVEFGERAVSLLQDGFFSHRDILPGFDTSLPQRQQGVLQIGLDGGGQLGLQSQVAGLIAGYHAKPGHADDQQHHQPKTGHHSSLNFHRTEHLNISTHSMLAHPRHIAATVKHHSKNCANSLFIKTFMYKTWQGTDTHLKLRRNWGKYEKVMCSSGTHLLHTFQPGMVIRLEQQRNRVLVRPTIQGTRR